jgi:protein involved in polysaccharide export with SLBB domain
VLRPNDRIRVFSKEDLKEDRYITIDGAVNKPNRFKYMENLTIEDLILMGGGLQEGANVTKVDVYRKVNDDKFETLSESFKFSTNGKLTFENNEKFIFEPGDRVSVRFLKGNGYQLNVFVEGETNYPGSYAMGNRGMKISDLLELSGGVSPYAFVEGASLIRLVYERDETGQTKIITEIDDEKLAIENIGSPKGKTSYRVGIDLEKIMRDPDSKSNLILKNGDILTIPSVKETVKVEGEVIVPSLIRFEGRSTLKDYISKSGGFGSNAKKGKTLVVYANGDIAATKHFLFFRSFPKIYPGAVVLVPSKEEQKRSKMSTQEIVALSTSVASFAILIQTLAN